MVPNAAPSTVAEPKVRNRTGGVWYTHWHLGQNILDVSAPISSFSPIGRTGWPLHCISGHVPNSLCAYWM